MTQGAPPGNPLGNPPRAVDALWRAQGGHLAGQGADLRHVRWDAERGAVELEDGAFIGSLVTAPVQASFPYNEAIPSVNCVCPPGSWVRQYLRLAPDTGDWSPWMPVGQWGDAPPWGRGLAAAPEGYAWNVDIVFAQTPATRAQFRVLLARHRERFASPALSLLGLATSNTLGDGDLAKRHAGKRGRKISAVSLDVPFRSQFAENSALARELCSPTSVAMVLEFLGLPCDARDVADAAYDRDYRIFGNWTYNVRAASQFGARGYVTRFRTWPAVYGVLAAGRPIVASIRFTQDELASPPYPFSEGHLLVVRGLTEAGDVITNDPALRDPEQGNGLVWRREDFTRAWFDHGGVGYVLFGAREAVEVHPQP